MTDLAGDVAFEAADDVGTGQSLGGAAFGVGAGVGVVGHAGQGDDVQGVIGLAVAAAVEAVAVGTSGGGPPEEQPKSHCGLAHSLAEAEAEADADARFARGAMPARSYP